MKYRCHCAISLTKIEDHDLGKKEKNRFRQYLLPFSSECCMYSSMKVTLFLSFFVDVKVSVLCQEKNTLGICESRVVRRIFGVGGR